MASVVVDTNVVSFLFKKDSRAELYLPHLMGHMLVISFMTLAELDRWALERNWGIDRRRKMEERLRNFLVYPYSRSLCQKWAEVTDQVRRGGRTIQCADAWIAATAVLHGLPLVTHNSGDFAEVNGLTLISEEAPPIGEVKA